jgi:hypothetical protein
MFKNRLWFTFLAVLGMATVYLTVIAAQALYRYSVQTKVTDPVTLSWSYQKVSMDVYAPLATFTFAIDGALVEGRTLLSQPLFRDKQVAEQVIQKLQQQSWRVWYSPKQVHYATIEKRFPVKKTLYAGIVLGIFLYFAILGYYTQDHVERQ